jgi:hypothetical protein
MSIFLIHEGVVVVVTGGKRYDTNKKEKEGFHRKLIFE